MSLPSHSVDEIRHNVESLALNEREFFQRLAEHIKAHQSYYTLLVVVSGTTETDFTESLVRHIGRRDSRFVKVMTPLNAMSSLNGSSEIRSSAMHQRVCNETLSLLEENQVEVIDQLERLLYSAPESVPAKVYASALSAVGIVHPYTRGVDGRLPVTVREIFVYGANTLEPFEREYFDTVSANSSLTLCNIEEDQVTQAHQATSRFPTESFVLDWAEGHPHSVIALDQMSVVRSIQSLLLANQIKPLVAGQGGLVDAPETQRLRVFLRWLDDDNETTYSDLYALSGRTLASCRRALKSNGYSASLYDNRLRIIPSDDPSLNALHDLGLAYTRLQFAERLHEKVEIFNQWIASYDSTFDPAQLRLLMNSVTDMGDWPRSVMSLQREYYNSQVLTTVHDPYPVETCHRLVVLSSANAERFSATQPPRTRPPKTLTTLIYDGTE